MNTDQKIDFERLRIDQSYRDSVMMLWICEWAGASGERKERASHHLAVIAGVIR